MFTPEQIQQKLDAKFNGVISLDFSTYKNTRLKCRFIHKTRGEFYSTASRLLRPDRSYGHPRDGWNKIAVSLNEYKERLKNKFGDMIQVKDETYVNVKTRCTFVDSRFDPPEFEAKPDELLITKNGSHPAAKRQLKISAGLSIRVTAEEIQERLDKIFNGDVTLKKETYTKMHDKATFAHKTKGEWEAFPYNVVHSHTRHPSFGHISKKQQELFEFVSSLDQSAQSNKLIRDTKNEKMEADILLESRKLIIEFDGLYYHRADQIGKYYHRDKTRFFEKLGYRVIHIFEDEWSFKRPIVESVIKGALNTGMVRINARDCEVRPIDKTVYNVFFGHNHLSGGVSASFAYGLYYKDRLVHAMSIRRNKKYGWEIARSASLLNHRVIGGFSKLLKTVGRSLKQGGAAQLMSYVDLRYGTGQSYDKCGFILDGITPPDMFWTDTTIRYARQKSWSDKSVSKRMYKIYGVGNKRYLLKL